jgi:hypothetical protein
MPSYKYFVFKCFFGSIVTFHVEICFDSIRSKMLVVFSFVLSHFFSNLDKVYRKMHRHLHIFVLWPFCTPSLFPETMRIQEQSR